MLVSKQLQVPGIQKRQEQIPKNHRQFIHMEGVDQGDDTAPETDVPEDGWHDDAFVALGMQPLHNKTGTEKQIAHEAECGPPR